MDHELFSEIPRKCWKTFFSFLTHFASFHQVSLTIGPVFLFCDPTHKHRRSHYLLVVGCLTDRSWVATERGWTSRFIFTQELSNWRFDWQFPCDCFYGPALELTSLIFYRTKHSKPTTEIRRVFQVKAACHCNNSPLSAEQSSSMLINEPGSASPRRGAAISSDTALLVISQWRWTRRRQSVLIAMKERRPWSRLTFPSLRVLSLEGNE